MDGLSIFALIVLIFVILTLAYGMIIIHDIPYHIAAKRNHPHQDAIHTAGWVSLFTLHAIWPFLWVWATIYQPERGYGFSRSKGGDADLAKRLEALETRLAELESSKGETSAPVEAAPKGDDTESESESEANA